ncbi:hypothetical protein LPJ61_005175, partial [Coemansia biformis]
TSDSDVPRSDGGEDGADDNMDGDGNGGAEVHGEGEPGEEEEYTADDYTEENYSDEYNDESIFSDSRCSESNYGADSDDAPAEAGAKARRLSLPSHSGDAGTPPSVIGAGLSSGAMSPARQASQTPMRSVDALAPPHRFVSHTPWGSSTGRLTRDQRHKAPMWDDPGAAGGSRGHEFHMPEPAHVQFADIGRDAAGGPAGHQHGAGQAEALYGHANGQVGHDAFQQQHKMYYQQPHQQQPQPHGLAASSAGQVVNMVSVHEGTENYNQLQQQIQRERLLQQDTIDAKLTQGQRSRRIVTIAQFIKSVSRLLSIGYPKVLCTESCLTAALVAVLGVRTGLDVWFANFNSRTVHAVVTYDRATLLYRLLPEYLGMLLPMAAVNQAIKWVISSLTIALRVRLGRYAHERYVDGITNITWSQLHRQGLNGSTPAYERPDWLLTVQIHRFADMLPRLVADVVKPTMDWCVFSRLLSRVIGRRGSLTMVLYVVLANVIIRLCSPPTGQHASHLAQLEEGYRSVYARVSSTIQRAAAASTPMVFQQQQQQRPGSAGNSISPNQPLHSATSLSQHQHGGQQQQQQQQTFVPRVQAEFRQKAKEALDGSLNHVASSVVSTNIRRFFGGIGETVLAKYGATLTAYYLLALPLCTPGRRLASEILHDPAVVMMSYSRNSAYLINLSQATTRLLLMVSDLPKFVWSTVRVDRLLRSLDVHSRYRSAVENLPGDDHSSVYSSD